MKKYSIDLFALMYPLLVASQNFSKSDRARSIVDAVNKKDARQYVENFSNDVKIFMYGEGGNFILRVDRKEALFKNRAAQLKMHPLVRNEI